MKLSSSNSFETVRPVHLLNYSNNINNNHNNKLPREGRQHRSKPHLCLFEKKEVFSPVHPYSHISETTVITLCDGHKLEAEFNWDMLAACLTSEVRQNFSSPPYDCSSATARALKPSVGCRVYLQIHCGIYKSIYRHTEQVYLRSHCTSLSTVTW